MRGFPSPAPLPDLHERNSFRTRIGLRAPSAGCYLCVVGGRVHLGFLRRLLFLQLLHTGCVEPTLSLRGVRSTDGAVSNDGGPPDAMFRDAGATEAGVTDATDPIEEAVAACRSSPIDMTVSGVGSIALLVRDEPQGVAYSVRWVVSPYNFPRVGGGRVMRTGELRVLPEAASQMEVVDRMALLSGAELVSVIGGGVEVINLDLPNPLVARFPLTGIGLDVVNDHFRLVLNDNESFRIQSDDRIVESVPASARAHVVDADLAPSSDSFRILAAGDGQSDRLLTANSELRVEGMDATSLVRLPSGASLLAGTVGGIGGAASTFALMKVAPGSRPRPIAATGADAPSLYSVVGFQGNQGERIGLAWAELGYPNRLFYGTFPSDEIEGTAPIELVPTVINAAVSVGSFRPALAWDARTQTLALAWVDSSNGRSGVALVCGLPP